MRSIKIIGIACEEYDYLSGGACEAHASPQVADFKLGQLSSPYHSLKAFVDFWIGANSAVDNHVDSIRIVSSGCWEHLKFEDSVILYGKPTLENTKRAINDWSVDCDNSSTIAIFYFCGHGIYLGNRLLLLEDFGSPGFNLYQNAINIDLSWEGFRGIRAVADCFFVDSCQEKPDVPRPITDNSGAFIFATSSEVPAKSRLKLCGSSPGGQAKGKKSKPSYFTRLVVKSLSGVLGEADAVVSFAHVMERFRRLQFDEIPKSSSQFPSTREEGDRQIVLLVNSKDHHNLDEKPILTDLYLRETTNLGNLLGFYAKNGETLMIERNHDGSWHLSANPRLTNKQTNEPITDLLLTRDSCLSLNWNPGWSSIDPNFDFDIDGRLMRVTKFIDDSSFSISLILDCPTGNQSAIEKFYETTCNG